MDAARTLLTLPRSGTDSLSRVMEGPAATGSLGTPPNTQTPEEPSMTTTIDVRPAGRLRDAWAAAHHPVPGFPAGHGTPRRITSTPSAPCTKVSRCFSPRPSAGLPPAVAGKVGEDSLRRT